MLSDLHTVGPWSLEPVNLRNPEENTLCIVSDTANSLLSLNNIHKSFESKPLTILNFTVHVNIGIVEVYWKGKRGTKNHALKNAPVNVQGDSWEMIPLNII